MPAWLRVIGIMAVLAQQGCAMPSSMSPVDWWHSLEGGRIAETRPPPPNADAPYPNLASVPPKPKADDQILRARVATGLLSDRASAQYAAATVPLVAPPAAPRPPAVAAATADESEAMGARLQAASAPPAMAAPSPATPSGTVAAAVMPEIPARAPPPPVLAGVGVPAITAATPPLAPPPVAPAPAVSLVGTTVAVPFSVGSAVLPPAGQRALRQLALRRGMAPIAVTGFGEAAASDPPTQSAALPLAWARAQAIAGTLRAAGVPVTMLRLTAEATGRGGVATIAD